MSARILFIGKDLLKENFVRERDAALRVLGEMLMDGKSSISISPKTRFLCTYSCFGNSEDSPTAIRAVGSLEALILEN